MIANRSNKKLTITDIIFTIEEETNYNCLETNKVEKIKIIGSDCIIDNKSRCSCLSIIDPTLYIFLSTNQREEIQTTIYSSREMTFKPKLEVHYKSFEGNHIMEFPVNQIVSFE